MHHVSKERRELTEVEAGVYLADLAVTERASMKYWRVEPGATLPTHRHEHDQIGFVIDGTMVAIADGTELRLEPGDSYAFPGGETHGAENRGGEPCVGVGIFVPPRGEPEWGTTSDTRAIESTD